MFSHYVKSKRLILTWSATGRLSHHLASWRNDVFGAMSTGPAEEDDKINTCVADDCLRLDGV